MKLSLVLSTLAILFTDLAFAHTSQGYLNRVEEARKARSQEVEYVYVQSLSELTPGPWMCKTISTYSGGPKTGSWRTYHVCKTASR